MIYSNSEISRYIGLTLILIVITAFSYSNAIRGGFVWDDDNYVTNNLTLKTWDGLKKIWVDTSATPQYYPLVFTAFWIEYRLWKYNPIGYHLVNILVHLSNVILLWILLNKLQIRWAFFTAAVFAIHPVHVESVAWITELKNVLSGMFYLLSILTYMHFYSLSRTVMPDKNKSIWLYIVSLFLYVCALLSKSIACSMPVAVLLIIWWKKDCINFKDILLLLPFLIIGIVMGLNTASLEKSRVGALGQEWDLSLIERCLIAGRALWFYAGKLIWPKELIFSYPRWDINSMDWRQYTFPISALGIVFLFWMIKDKIGKGPLVCVLFFSISLFPALGFIDIFPMIYSFVADHFQYLPSIGLLVLFPSICYTKCIFKKLNRFLPILASIILIILSALSWEQGKIYKDKLTFYSSIISKNSSSWMAYNNRGIVYLMKDEIDKAISDFSNALKMKPNHDNAYLNRGICYTLKGKSDLALADFEKAIQFNPYFALVVKKILRMQKNSRQ